MSPETKTPRTEAEIFAIQDCNGQLRNIVTPMFAKQLERELNEAMAEVERLKETLTILRTIADANLNSSTNVLD